VAKHPRGHAKIAKVIHPTVMSGEAKKRAETYLSRGMGALLGFELKDGAEAGRKFIDIAEDVLSRRQHRRRAQPRHPSRLDHAFAAHGEEQAQTGVTPGYVRLSIGLEHIDDILADLDQALAASLIRQREHRRKRRSSSSRAKL
jgi:O-acetylhomoserine (thiol)-lyase